MNLQICQRCPHVKAVGSTTHSLLVCYCPSPQSGIYRGMIAGYPSVPNAMLRHVNELDPTTVNTECFIKNEQFQMPETCPYKLEHILSKNPDAAV